MRKTMEGVAEVMDAWGNRRIADVCPTCDGRGFLPASGARAGKPYMGDDCPTCHGERIIWRPGWIPPDEARASQAPRGAETPPRGT